MRSMTSGQCDELREKAKLLRGHVDGLSAPYVIPSTKELMALTMLDSADRMEQAADTILELRDDLQRANEATRDAEHDESMAWDRVCKAEEENAKLREILKSLMMGTNAELCAGMDESDCKECSMYHGEDGCTVVNAMELLGIDMYGEPLGIEV